MKSHHIVKLSLLAAALLPCGLASGQAALNGTGGVNMLGVGKISNTPTITLPAALSGSLSWEQGPALQGYVVPAGQLTGLTTAGTPVSYEDLLPLKAMKLQVMTGAAGAAPSGVGTIIDSLGVDTNSVVTDAFQLVTGASAGKVLRSDAAGIGTWQTAPVAGDVGNAQTLTFSGTNLTISGPGGNTVNLSGLNTDNQTLTLSGGTLSISGGNSVVLPTGTDSQSLSLSGLNLGIAGGAGVTLPAPTPSVSGGNLVITTGGVTSSVPLSSFPNLYNSDGTLTGARTVTQGANKLTFGGTGGVAFNSGNVGIGTGVAVPGAALEVAGQVKITGGAPGAGKVLTSDASGLSTWQTPAASTDSQTLALSGSTLSISNGNSVNLSSLNTDSQNLSLTGLNLGISGGTGVTLPAPTVSLSGTTLSVANGGSVNLSSINTDSQNLSLSGLNLGISGGTGITLPTPTPSVSGGNLVITTGGATATVPLSSFPNIYNANGTLTADRTVAQGANTLTFTGTGGIVVNSGNVGIATATPASKLEVVSSGTAGGNGDDIINSSYGATANPAFATRVARGTPAAPANLVNGDDLGGLVLRGVVNNNTAFQNLSAVTGTYKGNGVTQLSDLRFTTSNNVGITIDQRGYLGIGTTTPGAKLAIETDGSTGASEDDTSITSYGIPSIVNFYNAARGTKAAPANLQNGDQLVVWGMSGWVGGGWQGMSGIRSNYRGNGTSPLADFVISTSNNDRLYINAGGLVGIGTNAPTSLLSVNGTADKVGGGAWGTFSDIRVKKDIKDYTKGLAEILKIHTVTFKYNEKSGYKVDGKEFVGVIAQEIEKVLPTTVTKTNTDPAIKDKRTFDSSELTYTLINAVKEQQAQISQQQADKEKLAAKVAALEADKAKLAAKVTALEAQAAEIAQIKTALEAMRKLVVAKDIAAPSRRVAQN